MRSLSDKKATNVLLVGGKAATLARLFTNFTIPNGFVVLPEDIVDERVIAAFDDLQVDKVAVRSSATHEDGTQTSWAGQLETFLNVERDNLLQAIQKCRASSSAERAVAYASNHSVNVGKVAVIVQEMIQPRISGVAFTKHPVTPNSGVVVEATPGNGDALVSGEVTPDTYIENGENYIVGDTPLLSSGELKEVTTLAKNVRDFLGYEVDIEWTFSMDTLYLLQARPITTL